MILVFKEFSQASIRPLISELYAKRYHDFLLKNFCLSAEKFRRGSLLCFRQILVPKNVRDKRGGGYHDILSKFFLSHSTEKFRRGTLLCFTKILESKKFMDKEGGEEGSITIFCRKIFVLQCRKKSQGNPLGCH